MSGVQLRAAREEDLPAVHALNQSEVPHVGDVDFDRMRWFLRHAEHFVVAEHEGELLGFVIALRPDSSYASPNYRWFCERGDDFVYVDRIAVSPAARKKGVARALYASVEDFARARGAAVTCEVNLLPPNPLSLEVHRRLGFVEVGRLEHVPGEKVVSMLRKETRGKASAGAQPME